MNLAAQIELITNPQEFTRLCNAVLTAKYDDDYLPIDDDQSDKGNDGYLKSEKRVFAAHCFKRIQKQKLRDEIKKKMVGDLGKAIALKEADIWDIERWTFLCNYPVSEAIASTVVSRGKKANIDVSWYGPDYFSNALQKHKEVRGQFPTLQTNEISEKLAALTKAVRGRKTKKGRSVSKIGVPRTLVQQKQLLKRRPGGWEYLLFAGVLQQGKQRLEMKYRDHELKIPHGARHRLHEKQAPDYLRDEFEALRLSVSSLMRVFDSNAQEQAFGPPGIPGDPVRIEHFAERIIITYEEMLDWAGAVRCLVVPDVFTDTFEVAAEMANQPIKEIREFIDKTVREVEKIPAHLAKPKAKQKPLRIELMLVLTIDDEVTQEFSRRIERAKRKVKWGF